MNLNALDNRVMAGQMTAELGISRSTLYKWSHFGTHADKLEIRKAGNGDLFCLRDEFDEFKAWYLFGIEPGSEQ